MGKCRHQGHCFWPSFALMILSVQRFLYFQQIEHLEKYDTSEPHVEVSVANDLTTHTAKAERRVREQLERDGADLSELENLTEAERKSMDSEKRAAWRKARLQSLENDAIQAQIVIEKMSQLVATDSADGKG